MKTSSIFRTIIFYSLAALFSCAILAWVVYEKGFSIYLPQKYVLDALFSGSGIKTIIETGWITSNPHLGAPLTSSLADYPGSDSLSFLIVKLLSCFSNNYSMVMNVFFFLTFPLTTLVSLKVFSKLGLRPIFAFVASLLFTFLPYHLMRGESHLFLTTLYVIPLYVLLIFSIFNNEKITWLRGIGYIAICIIAACSGVYYAFFACYFLLITGLLVSYSSRSWLAMIKPLILIGIIVITVIINMAPTFIANKKYGKNTELVTRVASESELAGLKITQMLFPVDSHRVHPFKILKQTYNDTAPLVNENSTATLGLIGSIGFIILLLFLFGREKITSNTWYLASRLNISAVLLGTVGGLGSMFAYLISPTIRSYNRISIFIAFFCLFAFFYFIQEYVKKHNIKKVYIYLILLILLIVGISDQVGKKLNPDYSLLSAQFNSDEKFVAAIENILPAESMVFQLPVAGFPENPPVYHMKDYELFRGYLHSHHLHWSYGAVRGRNVIRWQQSVAKKPIKEMLNELAFAGFSGIYIDRDGYEDQGKNIEKELTRLLKQKPLTSDDQTLVFYDMRNYVIQVKKIMSETEWNKNVERIHKTLMLEIRWYSGFHHHESELDNSRWSRDDNAVIRIVNYDTKSFIVDLNFILKTHFPVKVGGDLINESVSANESATKIHKQVLLTPGPHYLYFTTSSKQRELLPDGRRVYFRLSVMPA